jgi:hypothetical protein
MKIWRHHALFLLGRVDVHVTRRENFMNDFFAHRVPFK